MANNSLTIKVVFDRQSNGRKTADRNENRKAKIKDAINNTGKKDKTPKEQKLDDASKGTAAIMAIQVVSRAAGEMIDAGINSLDTFDMKIEQQKMNNIKSIVNRGTNAATSIAVGASVGGPVGAIIAGVGVALSEVINMAQRNMEWQTNQRIYDAETQRQSARLDEVTTSAGRHIKL